MTVRAHEANSHAKKGWESFTQKVIDTVAKKRVKGVVFLAWGSPAQKRCTGINSGKHLVLKSVHPSPLSAHKGFFECGHFKKANEWLRQRYGEEGVIDWNLDVKPEVIKPTQVGSGNKESEPEEDKLKEAGSEVGKPQEAKPEETTSEEITSEEKEPKEDELEEGKLHEDKSEEGKPEEDKPEEDMPEEAKV